MYMEPLMGGEGSYYFADCHEILKNLRDFKG